MDLLEIEALDLGPDMKAIGIELVEADENREPVRGAEASAVWSRALRTIPGDAPWALDFFSHLDRVRDYCTRNAIAFREANARSIVIPAPDPAKLEPLLDRFQQETFGVRGGGPLPSEDAALEGELARQGADAYHKAYTRYLFCGICNFEDASLVLLSETLWASEVIRRVRPALQGSDVEVRLPA